MFLEVIRLYCHTERKTTPLAIQNLCVTSSLSNFIGHTHTARIVIGSSMVCFVICLIFSEAHAFFLLRIAHVNFISSSLLFFLPLTFFLFTHLLVATHLEQKEIHRFYFYKLSRHHNTHLYHNTGKKKTVRDSHSLLYSFFFPLCKLSNREKKQ